jgi:4'-phosphopantetheinyl transferase
MRNSDHHWNIPSDNLTLTENEVHVWRASLEAPLDILYYLQHVLSPEEVDRARQFYFEKDRRYWTVAHGVLRMLLAHYLDIDPREIRFVTDNYGKPSIVYPSLGTRLHFNLSHSGSLALYAFTYDRHVGIDVEQMRANIDCEELAKYHFSPYECAVLKRLPAVVKEEAFFLCWSRKEAYIKARGKGLSIPLDQFDVALTPGEPAALIASREDPQATACWSLHALAPGTGYAGALVVEGTSCRLSCWQWQWQ